jgi:Flp pilus assembly protein TadG
MIAFLARQIHRFRRDQRGNIMMMFGLSALPVLTAVGCAVDYTRVDQMRSRLQQAIDIASVGAVAKSAPAFIAAGSMTGDGAIPAGATDARKIFDANMTGQTGYTLNNVTTAVTKTGNSVNSTVTFSANVPTTFLALLGRNAITVTGTSTAASTMPQYIDFYLLLDNSPSMGVGATPADINALVAATANKAQDDHCAFACHDLSGTSDYYTLAKSLGITTRIDVLRSATQQLMDTAANTETYSNQFRMAIYDFGGTIASTGLRSLFSLSSSLSSAKTAAGNIDLMTVRYQNDNGDQGTNFSTLFPALNNAISTPGTGTAAAPQKYVFFVSDGFADESNSSCSVTTSNSYWGNTSPRCQSPINPALCTTLKNRGIKIAVLYTTYGLEPMTDKNGNPTWYNSWVAPYNGGSSGPSANVPVAANMQACASPGFYFEVSPTQGISDAMNALFKKAVADARING